jgi:hypothetical protein
LKQPPHGLLREVQRHHFTEVSALKERKFEELLRNAAWENKGTDELAYWVKESGDQGTADPMTSSLATTDDELTSGHYQSEEERAHQLRQAQLRPNTRSGATAIADLSEEKLERG